MEEFRHIEFQRARDFSKKLNATFEFIKQNFKALSKSLIYIAGPAVLVGSILLGSFMNDILDFGKFAQESPDLFEQTVSSPRFWIQIFLLFVFLVISYVVSVATINSYLVLYDEKKTNKIEVNEVWMKVQKVFWTYLGSFLIFFFLFIALYIGLLIPAIFIGQASGLLTFFGILFIILALVFLMFSVSLTFFIQSYERKNFIDAITRSYRLVNNGKWWSTFGLIMVLQIIVGTISYIFLIPYYALIFINAFHDVSGTTAEAPQGLITTTVIFFTLYYMVQMFLYALPNVGIAFQYFNLVELKESKGLMAKINTLGEQDSPAPKRPEESY